MEKLALLSVAAAQQELKISEHPVHEISDTLWGVFFEDINFAADGGLYAELLRNRDFEALGRGNLGDGPASVTSSYKPPSPDYSNTRPWTVTGDAVAQLVNSSQPFATNPMVVNLTASVGGLRNPGYWGINVSSGRADVLSLFAQSQQDCDLEARLVDPAGQVLARTKVQVHGPWREYQARLQATESHPQAAFELVCLDECNVLLDHVSLFPGDAVQGLFRRDLFEKLKALPPSFVRFPGGNYLEGYDQASRWAWKNTVGPAQSRPGHYNAAWGYWVTDGMGLFEYLVLCEELGAAPQLSVYTGYSMGQPYLPLNASHVFAQDALDAMDFANGDGTWGQLRRQIGHPDSFGLKRFEVGNEEKDMENYRSHFELIAGAIKQKDPDAVIVASGRWGQSIEGNPCINGDRCDLWDDHYYRSPDVMANMSTQYDGYNRSLPDVFVGEYAANVGGQKTLQAALAEAMFMIGFERNADKVKQSSFAPLFNHINGTQWDYNLIAFDSHSSFGIPSYFVQHLFAANRGISTLQVDSTRDSVVQAFSASMGADGIIVKAVSYGAGGALSMTPVTGRADIFTLSGAPDAVNSFSEPLAVSPRRTSVDVQGSLNITVAPWSLVVVRFYQAELQV